MSGTHNILVISDLHLGEDLNHTATEESTRDLAITEGHLIEFLGKYTRLRADGRPWRLVFNGDMIDFLGICIFPGDRHPALEGAEHTEDEREHGLDRRRDAACAKVDAALVRHEEFFQALAQFIAAGNAVEITCGNHDTEFYWPEVQETFCAGVARAWQSMAASQRPGARSADSIRRAIRFHAWFYYEPGVVWIEHGHQYDECCSYEYNLNPVDTVGRTIIANVDTAAIRYMTNPIPEAAPHGTEDWTFSGYMRFAASLGLGGAYRLFRGYYRFAAKLVAEWRAARIGRARRARRAVHLDKLRALSQVTPLPEKTLHQLDSMQRPPVITNLPRLMQVLMLDRLVIGIGVLVGALLGFLSLPVAWALIVAIALLAGSHVLNRRLSEKRVIDSTLPLQIVPYRILEHVDARFVIFGHTHVPIAHRIDDRRWYFNTGTWVVTGRPGILRAFTHVVIRHTAGGPEAMFCQWRDGASRPFDPEHGPEHRPERGPERGPDQGIEHSLQPGADAAMISGRVPHAVRA